MDIFHAKEGWFMFPSLREVSMIGATCSGNFSSDKRETYFAKFFDQGGLRELNAKEKCPFSTAIRDI
jgi:hypothetical protein